MSAWQALFVVVGLEVLVAGITMLSVIQWAERKARRARFEGFKDGYRYGWQLPPADEGVVETAARGYMAQQEGKAVDDAIR